MLGLPAWGPSPLNAWRIRRHLNAVALDDEMLQREGCGRHLTIPELEEALLERGMCVLVFLLGLWRSNV